MKEGPHDMLSDMGRFMPTAVFEFWQKFSTELLDAQKKMSSTCQEISQEWIDRAKLEADVTNDFTSKLVASKSVSDTAKAWGDWANYHSKLATEDGKRLVADGQKIMDASQRFFLSGLH